MVSSTNTVVILQGRGEGDQSTTLRSFPKHFKASWVFSRIIRCTMVFSVVTFSVEAVFLPVHAQSQSPNWTPEPGFSLPSVEPAPISVGIEASEAYTLGPGDLIQMDIFNVPEFSGANGQFTVLVDGTLNLPWVGQVSVQGLTLREAATALTSSYAPYINDPLITVSLVTPRPVRVGITGEVNRPGSYILGEGAGTLTQFQTVISAIQLAGGITQLADIRQIEVHRFQGAGATEIIEIDLWDFLQTGNLSQDIVLRDGDTVIIPTATILDSTEATEMASAVFSPETIGVNVVGEVVTPGLVTLPPNATLNQAVLAAGGFDNTRANKGTVELIRLNPNGTVSRQDIEVDFSAGLNSETNPALRQDDIIIVRRSGLASTSDFLSTLLSPITTIFSVLQLFGL